MMTDWFLDLATSTPALGFNGLVLLVSLAVGFFPLVKYLPVIGPYVPAARVVALLSAALICFLVGFRVSDERAEMANLRAMVAIQKADLDNARKSAAFANARASELEKVADDRRQSDAEYIATLTLAPGCGFEPFPGKLRVGSDGAAGSVPRAPAAAR